MKPMRVMELGLVVALAAAAAGYFRPTAATLPPASAASPVAHSTQRPEPPIAVPVKEPTHRATLQWKALYDEAQAFLGQGDNARAEAKLVAALQLAPMASPEALHETLDDLGLVCFRMGEYQRSADYQSRAIEAVRQAGPYDAVEGLYESRYALALAALEQRDQALEALARARQCFENAYPAGSPAFSEAMNGLAAQHRSLGDYEGAAQLVDGK